MTPGAMATFRFVVQSQAPMTQTHAGFDVAASAGQLNVVSGEGEQMPLRSGELTHTSPKLDDANGVASWDFTWQAPGTAGTYTLFGAGNSVNRDFATSGDQAAATTFPVVVAALAPTMTPTPTLTPSSVSTTTFSPTATTTRTPTDTPRPSATETQTSTSTAVPSSTTTPTATATTSPTLTPSTPTEIPRTCTGDCDGNGKVSVNELVSGINIALGDRPLSDCPSFDCNLSGHVTVDCLVKAVSNALDGCPGH